MDPTRYRDMKVLHVIPVYEPAWGYGGPVRSVSLLCRELVRLGLDITVYTTTANGADDLPASPNQPLDIGGVKVFRFPLRLRLNYFYAPDLAQTIRRSIQSFDLVHITSIWNYPGIPATRQAWQQGIPYLYSARGSLIREDYPGIRLKNVKKCLYYRMFLRNRFEHAAAIHYTAQMEWEQSTTLTEARQPGFIIPNGIDCDEFECLPGRLEGLRYFSGLPDNSRVISYLGRLHPRKALDTLVHAFKAISERFPNVFLLLGGPDGGQEAFLRELVNSLGLNNRVRFLGLLDSQERRLLFSCTDIFSLAGYSGENFGMAAVEAMAAGIPVIVSDNVCIHPDIVADQAGLKVAVDETQLADVLTKLLADPELLTSMGKAAAASARKRYDKQAVARLMATAYQDIITGVRSPECSWTTWRN